MTDAGGMGADERGKNWNQVLVDLDELGAPTDVLRRQYLEELHGVTGRNVIAYYSGWLQKPEVGWAGSLAIHDSDKTGFMSAIHDMDTDLGLDLLLHTPGGDVAATESLVDYLHQKFGTNVRAIVPQLALSGGTLMAMSCSKVVMARHSSLGPIDPQFGAMPCHGIISEFRRASLDIAGDPAQKIPGNPLMAHVWAPILAKYHPTVLQQAQHAIAWAEQMAEEWLRRNMLDGDPEQDEKIQNIKRAFGHPDDTRAHNRHISAQRAAEAGLEVELLEDDQALQDAVLAVHHAYTLSFARSHAIKIIENHRGVAMVFTGPGNN